MPAKPFAVRPIRPPLHARHVLIVIYGALLLLCAAWIGHAHFEQRRAARAQAVDRMAGVAATLAAQLNARHVVALMERYREPGLVIKSTQDARYYVLHDHLRRAVQRLALDGPLRIVATDEAGHALQVIVTSDARPAFRAPHPDPGGGLIAACRAEGPVAGALWQDDRVRAYDRLALPDGTIVGLVVAEASWQGINAGARSALWRHIAVALAVFLLVGALLFTSVGRWLRVQQDRHHALQARHDDMAHGLAYAGRIQRALVPPAALYDEVFDGAFVIDRPKDLVSGDFHWLHRIDARTSIVATADCTGHGMPGAMMAAIGCALLNDIVRAHEGLDPAGMLAMLHARLCETLRRHGCTDGGGDGMDMALCRVDQRARVILFAGAHRPLYWLHKGELTVIKGDRATIGGLHHRPGLAFTGHRIDYRPGDRIYLLSDGYADQSGGPRGERFKSRRLHALITAHQHLDMAGQRDVIERTFLDWKGHGEQVDDICMLGIAV